ncbi:hypothetical protein BOX15_Mlig016917g3 [Macrostomum lignano]|uniref:Uncharacterized protein n=2 Tax=Macrostomum lignano TaxID=282301 RepID=A0A267EBK7_9PLAT|nr:hypothetical protein BOX15_Mlig016917g3 [Macrostomum lignano]
MQVLVGICFILACAVAVAVDGAADSTNTDNLSIASKRVSFIPSAHAKVIAHWRMICRHFCLAAFKCKSSWYNYGNQQLPCQCGCSNFYWKLRAMHERPQ